MRFQEVARDEFCARVSPGVTFVSAELRDHKRRLEISYKVAGKPYVYAFRRQIGFFDPADDAQFRKVAVDAAEAAGTILGGINGR